MADYVYTPEAADGLLDPIVDLPEVGALFERIRPLTDFRKDDNEARILYVCRRINAEGTAVNGAEKEELYVLKCKIQAPSVLAGGLTEPIPGPSEYTKAELQALQKFKDRKHPSLPHLVGWKKVVQGENGPMPGGYIAYVVMTLMPGQHLMDLKFWSLNDQQKDEIREAFIPVIKDVWRLGFEPYDCALRNILWETETRKLSLVDFEHWYDTEKDPINMNTTKEMERWGIKSRKPAPTHWQEWFINEGLVARQ